MAFEREQAIGKHEVLKKQIYELGVKASALIREIQNETESYLNDNDFSTMDFIKVKALAKELNALQIDYKEKVARMNDIKTTFNI